MGVNVKIGFCDQIHFRSPGLMIRSFLMAGLLRALLETGRSTGGQRVPCFSNTVSHAFQRNSVL